MKYENLNKANEIHHNIRELDDMIKNKVRLEEYGKDYERPVCISDPVFYENLTAFFLSEEERMLGLFEEL